MTQLHSSIRRGLAASFLAGLLSACGGGGGDSTAGANPPPPPAPPPPAVAQRTVRVQVSSALAGGESFQFSLGSQSATVTQSATPVAFGSPLAEGSSYTVNQTAGPRTCTFGANRSGSIGAADVLVTADCGTAVALVPLSGELRAPVGSQATLRNNGGDDLALTVTLSPGNVDAYEVKPFTFATQLPTGGSYAVTVATPPAGQTCSVYKGPTGTVPLAAGALKVGCEWNFDHVSRSTDNSVRGTRFESWKPSIGGDSAYGEGRFVAFASSATGLSPNGQRQVFWRDSLTGVTRLISADASGNAGNASSDRPAISADGLTVVFESAASNLVAGDGNGVRDVFRWSAAGGSIASSVTRVSLTSAGGEANGASHTARVSADGRVVAFTTEAPNLVGGVSGANVIRRDVVAGTNTVVSANGSGVAVGGTRASISADGNRIAFWSYAADITAGDSNGLWDIFVYQHDNNSRRRISLRADGGERNQGTDSISGIQQPVISGNGRFVVYPTSSSNVVAGDTNAAIDLFLVDLDGTEATRRVNVSSAGAQANADSGTGSYWDYVALSHDATWIAFASRATNLGTTVASGLNLFLHNRGTGQTRAITDSTADVDEVSISLNAAYLAFGAGTPLDGRFASTGLFAHFTGIGRAWWWVD
jgi:hypothetical protein